MRKTKPMAGQMTLFAFVETDSLPLPEPVKIIIPSEAKPASQAGFVVSSSDEIQVAGSKGKVKANIYAISLLYQLEREGREPSAEEQTALMRYASFGGLATVFDPHGKEPELYQEIKALLTPEDYKSARAATTNAFYTAPEIIKAMWQYLERLGFTGGRVLEPAAATGLFFAGMPAALRKNSELTAVELDKVSGRIGTFLHPDALYHIKGFEEAELVDGYFDLIISNVPFGDYPIHDQTFSKDELALSRSIHNYYFVKAARLVRPGGIVAFITSRWTMDSKGDAVRAYLAERFKLLGAVRLPSNAFRAFSGTDVVTDVVFLQKYAEGEAVDAAPLWLDSAKVTLKGPRGPEDFWINRYFQQEPDDHVLGLLKVRTGPFSAQLEVDGNVEMEHMAERILAALPVCPEPVYQTYQHKTSARLTEPIPFTDVRKGAYGYMVVGGVLTVYQKQGYEAVQLKKAPYTLKRICGLVDLVAIARNVLTQCLHGTDAALAEAQAQLNEVYDAFVKEFGFINSKVNRQVFAEDPNAPFLRALEHYNAGTNRATKAKIFCERTIKPQSIPNQAASALDALILSMNQKGIVDMPYMMQLYGKTEQELVTELGDKLYHDPVGGWCTKDEYLSGNVVTKLIEARLAASSDPSYARNVADLEAVQPVRLTAQEITASLGATWIPKPILRQFVMELVDSRSKANHMDDPNWPAWKGRHSDQHYWTATVSYTASLGQWAVSQNFKLDNALSERTWGTGRRSAFKLVEALLNGSQISIYDRDSRTDQLVFNAEETLAAREKANEISRLFRKWVWVDPDRAATLVDLYNDTFRCMVERSYDGDYLDIPNTSTELPALHKHQRDAIARAIQGGNLLLWHLVGAGKSRVMIISAMEMKRLGLRNKPIHVVPNHLLEQYAHEFYLVYPNANLLVVDSAHMSPSEKQETLAKIATEDWDSILINHSAFQRIPLSVETWENLIQDEIDELDNQIEDLKEDKDQRTTVKRLEAKKKRLEERLERKRSEQSYDKGGLNFEQLGIDLIIYDELHTAKNLYYGTNREHIAGIGGSDSGVAFDLYIKVQYMTRRCTNGHLLASHAKCHCGADRAPAGSFIGATGTAITNSIAEAFTWMRFFAMDLLIEQGIESFDAWAAMYGDTEVCIEMHPSGKWVAKERFVRFNNVPELMAIFKQFADIQIDPQKLGLKRPKLYTDAPIAHEIQPSAELQAVMEKCARRADNLKNVKPWEDNMLSIMHTATAAATDLRLVQVYVDHPDSKINILVQNVFDIWQRTRAVMLPGLPMPVGLTQLVFLDIGVPGGYAFNLYQDIKDKLVKLGVPAEQIAFAQDAETDQQKKQLYNDMNEGRVSITLATTARFGTGVNAQRLLCAVHHPDAPWTPALMEQRDGRILRQGNLNEYVYIMRYIVARSLDHHKWHLLTLKANANRQLFAADSGKRSVEDLEMAVLSFSQMRALATGDPLLMEKVKVEAELTKLYMLYDKWNKDHRDAQSEYAGIDSRIATATLYKEEREHATEYRQKFTDKAEWWKVQGRRYTERADAGNHFGTLIKNKLVGEDILELPYAKVTLRMGNYKVLWAILNVDGVEISCELGDSGSGALTRIDNKINEMEGDAKYYQRRVAELIARKAQLEQYLKIPFERQGELDKLQQTWNELDAQLADKARGTEQPTE